MPDSHSLTASDHRRNFWLFSVGLLLPSSKAMILPGADTTFLCQM